MRNHRGSALIAALIVIAILALVTVATLQLAGLSKGQSAKDARTLSQTACVEAARQYLLSRLRVFSSVPITNLTFNQAVQVETGTRQLYTGHVRPVVSGQPQGSIAVITSVVPVQAAKVGGAKSGNRDLSNVIAPNTLGGKPYQVVVACTDPLAGDMELEFTFRYGL